ncbi:TetR/AcrR family transcriptional regulator [Alcanivorax sp. DP30]|uniref:TetR/AcrR family transcriptional regulator n=1 Tax=Alcanivorax sp. DP30 TaxID=2606217 RepID=UPI00136FF175|nr:TetR/AcrR family transcriptional regulator [Alcanivorax sp. DP30]MZR63874.1 TetR family transcriptional regulator [Alcanivorax sp. DP30]
MSQQSVAAQTLLQNLKVPEGDKTYEKILDAGLSLFVEFGLRRTTMEDVATRAGIGRATAYRRFTDKDQLIQVVILRECQRELTKIEADLRKIEGGLERVLESFVLAVTRAYRHPLLSRLMTSEPETILPMLTQRLWQMMGFFRIYLASLLDKVKKDGAIRDQSSEMLAELMLRLMQSMVLSPDGVMNPADEASVRKVADLYLRPLLAR